MFKQTVLVLAVLAVPTAAETPQQSRAKARAAWLWDESDRAFTVKASLMSDIAKRWDREEPKPTPVPIKVDQQSQYNAMMNRAAAEHKPLIVGVKCDPPKVSWALQCRWDGFPGIDKPSVIVGYFVDGKMVQSKPFAPTEHADTIKTAIFPKTEALGRK